MNKLVSLVACLALVGSSAGCAGTVRERRISAGILTGSALITAGVIIATPCAPVKDRVLGGDGCQLGREVEGVLAISMLVGAVAALLSSPDAPAPTPSVARAPVDRSLQPAPAAPLIEVR